jgi:transporter family-2 protein
VVNHAEVEGDFKFLAKDCEMQNTSAAWLYPIIVIAGALQAWGPPMNHNLRVSLENPWLASLVSFLPIVALLACLIMCLPHPLPSARGLAEMPWWAPLGGVVGAFAIIAGLLFVGKVGAGAFAGLTITANDVACHRPVWNVRHASARAERGPYRRCGPHGRRHHPDIEILEIHPLAIRRGPAF